MIEAEPASNRDVEVTREERPMWRTQSMCCGARSARRSGEHQPGEECDLPATSARHSLPATSAYQAYRTSVWLRITPAPAPARALLFTSPNQGPSTKPRAKRSTSNGSGRDEEHGATAHERRRAD
jgi:hypothetical protein